VRIFGIFHQIDGQFWVFQSIRMNAEKGGGKDRKGGFSMKKGKILMVGLIALLMAGGLVLAGCDTDDGGSGPSNSPSGGCNNKRQCYRNDTGMSTCSVSSCAINKSFSGNATCNCN
jgi:hypothetical protein